jgi:hypothetical protein
MKIKKVARVALVPAAGVGVTVSSWAAVRAATGHPGEQVQAQVRHVGQSRQGEHSKARPVADSSALDRVTKGRTPQPGRVRLGHRAQASADRRAQATADHRAHAKAVGGGPTPQSAAPSAPSLFAGMSAFERCVAWRESGNNPTASSAGLFGILPSTWASLGYPGTAGEASVAMQKAAFDRLYAQYGTSPWAPYDGC